MKQPTEREVRTRMTSRPFAPRSKMPPARCEVCGNEYDKAFQVTMRGASHTFDSFECAIQAPGTPEMSSTRSFTPSSCLGRSGPKSCV